MKVFATNKKTHEIEVFPNVTEICESDENEFILFYLKPKGENVSAREMICFDKSLYRLEVFK